ncbi:hypothetical protein ANCDUO_19259, partial [Ancylostoma duodenale]
KTLAPGNKIGDCLYQLDAMASICIGAAWLTFPKWLLHKQITFDKPGSNKQHRLSRTFMGFACDTKNLDLAHLAGT